MNVTNALPAAGVFDRDAGDRAIGKYTNIETVFSPDNPGLSDLLGDTFHALYSGNPRLVKEPNPDRVANHAIMQWALESNSYRMSREFTQANRPASMAAAATLWEFLRSSDVFEAALAEQEKISAKMERAAKIMDEVNTALESGETDEQSIANMLKLASDIQQSAAGDAATLSEKLEKLGNSPIAKGAIATAAQQAAQTGEQVATVCQAMGIEDAEISAQDAQAIIDTAKNSGELIKTLAELIGRLKDIAFRAGDEVSIFSGGVEVGSTRDLEDIWEDEISAFSGALGELAQIEAIGRYVQGGLVGWTPRSDKRKRGVFTAMIDESGSMTGLPYQIAKSLGIGLATVAGEQGRAFQVTSFGGWKKTVFTGFDHNSSAEERLDWLKNMIGGGTNFNHALMRAIRDVENITRTGLKGVDMLFITDDEGQLDADVIERWNKFRDTNGVRMLLVTIGTSGRKDLEKIADRVLPLSNLRDGENIANQIGKWLAD